MGFLPSTSFAQRNVVLDENLSNFHVIKNAKNVVVDFWGDVCRPGGVVG